MYRIARICLALLPCFALTACPKPGPPVTASVTPTAPAAASVNTPAAKPAAATAPAEQHVKLPPEQPLGDAYTANKKHKAGERENDKELDQQLSYLRPKQQTYVDLEGSKVEVDFTAAKLRPAGAHLDDLTFTLGDGTHSASCTMTDKQRAASMTVSLGWVRVRIKPQPGNATETPMGAGSLHRVQRFGTYDVELLDSAGKLMAIARITEDRRMIADVSAKGYEAWMRRDPEWEDDKLLDVAKKAADGSTTNVVLVRWADDGPAHQSLTDAKGNIFEYDFPRGRLELIKP